MKKIPRDPSPVDMTPKETTKLFFFFEWPEDTEEGKPLLPHYCVPLTELNSWFYPGIQAGRYPESSLPKMSLRNRVMWESHPLKPPSPWRRKLQVCINSPGARIVKRQKTAYYVSLFMLFQWLRHTLQGVGSWW